MADVKKDFNGACFLAKPASLFAPLCPLLRGLVSSKMHSVFPAADKDKSGMLDKAEVCSFEAFSILFPHHPGAVQGSEESVREIMYDKHLDEDGDGCITFTE